MTDEKPPLRDALIALLREYGAKLYDRAPAQWWTERYSIYTDTESFDMEDIADEVNRDE